MTLWRRELPAWTTAPLVVAGCFLVATTVFVYALAARMLERVARENALLGVQALAAHLEGKITQAGEDLGWAAAVLPKHPQPLAAAGPEVMARVREHLARFVVCVAVVDEQGAILLAKPSCPVDEAALRPLARRARERPGQAATQVAQGASGGHVLLMAVAAATGPPAGSERVMLGAFDVPALLAGLPEVGQSLPSGTVFVLVAGNAVAYRIGAAGGPHPLALAALLPGDACAEVREALTRGEAIQGPLLVADQGRAQRHELLAARRDVAGQTWIVAALLPNHPARDEARTLRMAGIALTVALAAGLVVVGVGIRRAGRGTARSGRWSAGGSAGADPPRSLVERVPEPALVVTSGVVDAVNAEARRLFDWRAQGPARDFVAQFDSRDRAQVERALALGQAAECVGRVHLGNGDVRTVKLRMVPAGVGSMLVTIHDRTTVERAEALLRAVSGAVPLGLLFTDRRGRLLWASAACRERTGYPLEQHIGEDLLFLIEREDHRRARALLARGVRGSGISDVLRVRGAAGEVITVGVHAVPVGSTSLGTAGVLFLARERDVRKDAPETGQRGETLGHLSRTLAGRLNNDFQAIFGLLGGLEEGADLTRARERLGEMLTHAAAELQRFVVVGRTSPGHLGPLRLSSLVQRWHARAAATLPPQLRFRIRFAAAADRVLADEAQLTLVLDLYLAEAQAALAHCDGAVEVAVEPAGKPGEAVVSVSRTLITGTAPATAPTDTLVQVYSAREAALAVAELVAARHGGSAGLRQRAGLESCFWLALPVLRGREGESRHQVGTARWGPVVLADDEEMVRASLADALRSEGLEVVEASNGQEAVDVVAGRPGYFALAILDLVMPVLDGRGALLRLREVEPGLPVLLCTGYDPEPDEALATADLIIKPFRLEEFVARVRTLMGVSSGPSS